MRAATRVCVAVQDRLVSAQTLQKKDRSPVTVADFASQAVTLAVLGEHLPRDVIVAEEDSQQLREEAQRTLRASVVEHAATGLGRAVDEAQVLSWIDRGGADATGDRFWTLDPIDGTKGFLRRGQYVVALALIESNRVVLGVLGCPQLEIDGRPGALLYAVRGHATRLMPLESEDLESAVPQQVSNVTDTAQARFCESVESSHSDQSLSTRIASRLGITSEVVRMDSQAKYAAVARADASIYMRLPTRRDYCECIWDHAAGSIIVEEAGGRVTDIDGRVLQYGHGPRFPSNRGVLATNGSLHGKVVQAIRKSVKSSAAASPVTTDEAVTEPGDIRHE